MLFQVLACHLIARLEVMECPRDTKSVVGEVHLMEEDNDENEILVDANGQWRISC